MSEYNIGEDRRRRLRAVINIHFEYGIRLRTRSTATKGQDLSRTRPVFRVNRVLE